MKAYKSATPENTVNNIREILYKCGILLKDNHIDNDTFFSCRISLANSRLSKLNIGTNGKGRNFEFSLASGYAEFMERLQNRLLLTKRKHAQKSNLEDVSKDSYYYKKLDEENLFIDWIWDKDELTTTFDEVYKVCGSSLHRLYSTKSCEELKEVFEGDISLNKICTIPFYSVSDDKVIYLPIELFLKATGSNGMCAGNTCHEAILQGICEIFERYVCCKIYNNELTLPTISKEYFKDEPVYKMLSTLAENADLDIIVKDCSLGMGFPALGVIIIDRINQTYNFKIGVDFIPEIALERCLTEIHQGTTYFRGVPADFFDLRDNFVKVPITNHVYHNLNRTFVNSSGLWSLSLFKETPSYEFEGFNENLGQSNESDLKYSLDLVKKLGYDIYIRDNSFLGFPTYYIAIPGMSQILDKSSNQGLYLKSNKYLSQISAMGHINKELATKFATAIEENYELFKYHSWDYRKLYLYNIDPDILDLDLELFAFMLFTYIGKPVMAKKYIDLFLIGKAPEEYYYYFCIQSYYQLKYVKQLPDREVLYILTSFYGAETAEEAISDVSNPELIFDHYDFPNCYECETCKVKETCLLFDVLKIEKKMNDIALETNIQQIDLSNKINPYL